MRPNLTGLILAGGRSSRFGGDKALAPLGGHSLLERAAGALRPLAPNIAVSAIVGSATAAECHRLGFPVIFDRPGLAQGPLAGILAGLEWSEQCGAQWMISLPCDVISLPVDAFERLLAATTKANGACAVTAQGPQSLCAVWPVKGRTVLEDILAGGSHPPVREAANLMGCAAVSFEEAGTFFNINTKDDLQSAKQALTFYDERTRSG
jgi:molybdopterin-guanine dinucleotide biosynthesis protein A